MTCNFKNVNKKLFAVLFYSLLLTKVCRLRTTNTKHIVVQVV